MATRIPSAVARKDMAAVLRRAARGERIKVTKHNRTIAVLLPKQDLAALENCEEKQKGTPGSPGSR
jgi:prevent-host-death family protein